MSDLVPSDFTPRSSEKRASESTQRRREVRSTSHSPSRDSRRSKDRRRDRSRSRDHRSRRRRSRSRPRHRDDRYRQRRHSRSRSHSRDRSRDRDRRRNGIGGGGRRDRRRGGDARVASASHPDQDELDQLERTSRTVQVYNLNLRAEERELFQFFSQAGPLVDIKIIRDRASGRSKGFAYVEFQHKASVVAALSLTGQSLLGQTVMVKMSEAEKNVAWEQAQAAKRLQQQQGGAMVPMTTGTSAALGQQPAAATQTLPTRVEVSNLHPSISEADLRPIFEPFGAIELLSVQRDVVGQSLGQAVVQFASHDDASRAAELLTNKLEIVGQMMQVRLAPVIDSTAMAAGLALQGMAPGGVAQPGEAPPESEAAPASTNIEERVDLDATDGGGLRLTAQSRAALMTRLAANAGIEVPQLPPTLLPSGATVNGQGAHGGGGGGADAELALQQGVLGPASPIPTQCLLLKNMFDPEEETEPGWAGEIAEDVRDECSKYGRVEFVHVDQHSQGFVYVKFDAVTAATAAQRALHGRWFNQRQLHAEYQFAPVFNAHFNL